MTNQTPSLKPYVAWVTDLIDRYWVNPFFRATSQIVLIQLIFSLILILLDPSLTHTFIILIIVLFSLLLIYYALEPAMVSLRLQKRFIGNMAHEIRTPLAIIKTETEVALMDPSLSSTQRQTLEGTLTELSRISDTINTILTFNAFLRPQTIKKHEVDFGKIIEMVVARHQSYASARGITIHMVLQDEQIICGNAEALDQVITNLLKNAINFTPSDLRKTVEIRLENAGNKTKLTITDEGIGIREEDIEHIFEPYFRSDTSRNRPQGSTSTNGLGLAIVDEIVRRHKGRISVKSTFGKGTEILILFPLLKK